MVILKSQKVLLWKGKERKHSLYSLKQSPHWSQEYNLCFAYIYTVLICFAYIYTVLIGVYVDDRSEERELLSQCTSGLRPHRTFTESVLKKYGMEEAKPIKTPVTKLVKESSLQWARPDIAFANLTKDWHLWSVFSDTSEELPSLI